MERLAEAGAKYLASREAIGLKRGTLQDYESYLRVHLVPFFADRALEQVDIELVEAFVAAKRREGKAVKIDPQLHRSAARDIRACHQTGLVRAESSCASR